jgi:hypothetical protein
MPKMSQLDNNLQLDTRKARSKRRDARQWRRALHAESPSKEQKTTSDNVYYVKFLAEGRNE